MMKRDLIKAFIKMLLPALAAILAIVYALSTFGWFSMAHSVAGTGTNMQSQGIEELKILTKTGNEDISAAVVDDITKRLPYNEGSPAKLSPTARGSFSFRVECAEAPSSYDFIYRLSIENDRLRDKDNEGFDSNTDDEERNQAKQYMNSHLLFFSEYDMDTKLYGGWLPSGDPIRCTADQNPKMVTVYWVWVDQYKQIFEENSGLIDEETRKEIAAYYQNHTEMMLADGATPTEAYNVADTLIGMTLKYICFMIEVTKA